MTLLRSASNQTDKRSDIRLRGHNVHTNPSTASRLLSKVSRLYYDRDMTQREIADRLHLSRPKVSRLLRQAREEGIVQITVYSPPGIYPELEEQLETQFGLQEAIVVEVTEPESQEAVSREVGIAAANYLQRTLRDGDTIGISWGTTLNAMVNALHRQQAKDVHVVQVNGGLGPPEAETHVTYLCRRLSQLLPGKLTLLPAPGIVDNQEAKRAILSDSHVQSAFDLFSQINVAYVGIGAPTPTSVVMRDGSILQQHELDHLLSKGAVGDIALRFFDRDGKLVQSDLDERVIGIDLQQLKQIERVVGVAGGPDKDSVIRGALAGELVNVLITDHALAMRLLGETPVLAEPA